MATGPRHDSFRELPSVDKVVAAVADAAPAKLVTGAARRAIDLARDRIRAGRAAPSFDEVVAEVRSLLARGQRDSLHRVVNATGVMIHTNLGRVPLGRRQLEAVAAVASGYSNLEYDVSTGSRGSRHSHAGRVLAAITGAEAAVVVNNNAAAVLLVLAALGNGKEVIVSRGELIEIGGEFRIPDLMGLSGARLVEVGTTNRTHLGDYERAITEDAGVILKVHPSNYRIVGFTASVAPRELARLAQGRKLWFVHDVGSGLVAHRREAGGEWLTNEPSVEDALADGADVVTFSGDKLFGGPQAGIVVGRSRAINKVSAHPLMRAVRPDKMTLAAIEATALEYLESGGRDLPVWEMALTPADELRARAEQIAARLLEAGEGSGLKAEAVPSAAVSGGGSLPGSELSSWAVALSHPERSAAEVGRSLRHGRVPVVGRIEDDRVLLDVRTIRPDDDYLVVEVAAAALGAPA